MSSYENNGLAECLECEKAKSPQKSVSIFPLTVDPTLFVRKLVQYNNFRFGLKAFNVKK